ncbi:MAG: peptidase M14 [Chromatiaceae bacterium]|nr:MAG: peptidase M14 [Chromatiaceae bacterium]
MPTAPAEPRLLTTLPPGLLDCNAADLAAALDGPTLIELPGARTPALFVSVLMHGNEPVGWDAVRLWLRRHLERHGELRLPRAMCLFIGNVRAAAANARHLPDQPDYNRVWPGSELPLTPEHGMMQWVCERMAGRGLFASIDLHNNTGANPHYACVNVIDNRALHLATLFSRIVVYFICPRGVQSQAMAQLCPAVTLECGKVGEARGLEHSLQYLDACLHLAELPDHGLPPQDIDLFHTVAQVRVPPGLSFGFPPQDGALVLSPDLERQNFRELPPGTAFGRVRDAQVRLEVRDEQGRDVGERYFAVEDGELRLQVPVMPAMLSHDETVIRQDCLCYLMERYNHQVPPRR